MHITLESDYAVRIVYCLAMNHGRMDAKHIAEETGVTLRFSLKILRKLVGGGLVTSYKGTKGGYELAREPEAISLCDVIEEVEGPYGLSRCVSEDGYECNRNKEACGICKFHSIYSGISRVVRQELQMVNFAQLMADEAAAEHKCHCED